MIGWLRGKVRHREANRCIVDVGGVGYEVFAPNRCLDAWGRVDAAELFVSTQVREDAISLYGFETAAEKMAFDQLLTISGVGPKVALATLDGLTVDALVRAIETDDVNMLGRVRGVGKKTAQRMALDLKGKLAVPFTPTAGGAPVAPVSSAADPLALALERLGYGKAEIEHARRALAEAGMADDAPVADRLRAALRVLYQS